MADSKPIIDRLALEQEFGGFQPPQLQRSNQDLFQREASTTSAGSHLPQAHPHPHASQHHILNSEQLSMQLPISTSSHSLQLAHSPPFSTITPSLAPPSSGF